jgi:chemotaxis protein methyltransferase CheR
MAAIERQRFREELLELLQTRFGLSETEWHNRRPIQRTVRALEARTGRAGHALLRWLAGLPDDDPAWAPLISAATTGETHFFRDQEQFRAVARAIMPILADYGGPLRLWSAATSTGAEAWSLAFTLADYRLGRPLPGDFVLGTDIDSERLDAARTGIYGAWAFREVAAADLPGRFRRMPDGKQQVRRPPGLVVRFAQHNLLRLSLPSAADRQRFDLIMCRNALLYLDEERVPAVIDGLVRCLNPGGFLMVAPCETHLVRRRLTTEVLGGVAVFSRSSPRIQKHEAPAVEDPVSSAQREIYLNRRRAEIERAREEVAAAVDARRAAAAAAAEGAARQGEDGAEQDSSVATLLNEAAGAFGSGEGRRGMDLLRQVLYQEPDNLPALVLRATHATTAAVRQRSAKHALRTLEGREDEDRVSELDDAMAGEVRRFLSDLLRDSGNAA